MKQLPLEVPEGLLDVPEGLLDVRQCEIPRCTIK